MQLNRNTNTALALLTFCSQIACRHGSEARGGATACASTTANSPSQAVRQGRQRPGRDVMRLELEPAEGVAAQVYVRLILTNTSEEILWFNYHFVTGPQEGNDRSIWFDVVNVPTGEPLSPGHCAGRMMAPGPHDYLLLAPSAAFSAVVPIWCTTFPNRGPWRIVAHYEDPRKNPEQPPEYAYWVTGPIVSTAIEMEAKMR